MINTLVIAIFFLYARLLVIVCKFVGFKALCSSQVVFFPYPKFQARFSICLLRDPVPFRRWCPAWIPRAGEEWVQLGLCNYHEKLQLFEPPRALCALQSWHLQANVPTSLGPRRAAGYSQQPLLIKLSSPFS